MINILFQPIKLACFHCNMHVLDCTGRHKKSKGISSCFSLVFFVSVNPLSDLCDIRGPLCLCSDCTGESTGKNSVEKLGSAHLKTDNILAIGPKLVHPSFCSEIKSHKAS